MTLTEFLEQRLAEDEAVARAAVLFATGKWRPMVLTSTFDDPPKPMWYSVEESDGTDEMTVVSDTPAEVECADGTIYKSEPRVSQLEHIARHDPARVLAQCAALRQIVELHKSWPVLVQTPPTFEQEPSDDPNSFVMRTTQQISWLTEQEYRYRFGDEPPTAPMLRALATIYADHPDFDPAWRPT